VEQFTARSGYGRSAGILGLQPERLRCAASGRSQGHC
jgi:hypothetical protein